MQKFDHVFNKLLLLVVLGVMLGSQIPVSVAIIIAALARLLVTVIELGCVMAAVLKKGFSRG